MVLFNMEMKNEKRIPQNRLFTQYGTFFLGVKSKPKTNRPTLWQAFKGAAKFALTGETPSHRENKENPRERYQNY